jgi:hypothetical protein
MRTTKRKQRLTNNEQTTNRGQKKMKSKLISGLIGSSAALCLLVSATEAKAFSIGADDVIQQDGLEWLKLTVTQGSSYNAVQSEFTSGGLLEGWRFATLDEFNSAWSAYSSPELDLADVFGDTFGYDGGGANGMLAGFPGASIYDYSSGMNNIGRSPWQFGNNDSSRFDTGSFLVRSAEVQDVPEPITGLVVAAGMGGAALRRAKNKKQSKES